MERSVIRGNATYTPQSASRAIHELEINDSGTRHHRPRSLEGAWFVQGGGGRKRGRSARGKLRGLFWGSGPIGRE